MTRIRSFFRGSFGSALLGGVVAVALGVVAIATGLVSVDNSSASSTAVASAPLPQTEPASGVDRTVGQVYQEDAQGVAYIEAQEKPGSATSPFGEPSGGGTATGSGILMDSDGHVLTNAHVVDGSSSVTVKFGDGEALPAKVLGVDDSTDVAVLEVDPAKVDAQAAGARRLRCSQGRRRGDRDRQSLRPRPDRHRRASSPRCSARSALPTASRSPT